MHPLHILRRPSLTARRGVACHAPQVFQDVDTASMQLDNVVELCFRVPTLPFVSVDEDPVTATITLGHAFQVC